MRLCSSWNVVGSPRGHCLGVPTGPLRQAEKTVRVDFTPGVSFTFWEHSAWLSILPMWTLCSRTVNILYPDVLCGLSSLGSDPGPQP